MKIYTFPTQNNTKKYNNIICDIFRNKKETNYSTLLDNIISSNIKKTNTYLNKIDEDILIDNLIAETKSKSSKSLKGDFITALTYLANFGTTSKLPFKLGHTYYFGNNTPIIFHLDSIEIGSNEYYYDDLLNNTFAPTTKKTIIDIYLNGNKNIDININI